MQTPPAPTARAARPVAVSEPKVAHHQVNASAPEPGRRLFRRWPAVSLERCIGAGCAPWGSHLASARHEVPCDLTNGEANGYQGTAKSGETACTPGQRSPRQARCEAQASRRGRAIEGASCGAARIRGDRQVESYVSRGFTHAQPVTDWPLLA